MYVSFFRPAGRLFFLILQVPNIQTFIYERGWFHLQQLKDRIVREGKVLPGNIIKVDGFLNHRVDTKLMEQIADEFAKHFDISKVTLILTAEASGIALATICAYRYGVPMVFAKKAKSDNIEGGLFRSDIFSYTYKIKVTQLVSREWLSASDKVLIVDDFLANGEALRGLCEIVEQAGATLVGIGVAIEKGFQGGGDRLRAQGYDVVSLATIEQADPNGIVFREDED
jgi:xanthine phosphoribosyltransferase